jgi:aryl-alcohol dehydrogenase-like predicted oxidoreductase
MPPRVRLGDSPVEIAPLGVGCWAWGDRRFWRYEQDHGPEDVVAAFKACLGAGLDFYDTAEAYGWGKSEQILGALERKSGQRLVIATKYAPMAGRGGPAAIRGALAASLKRLHRGYIDLYQLHWPDRDEAPIPAVMDVLADAVDAGEIRAVGVSNFSAVEMRAAHAALARRGVPLAANQVHYSLLHRTPEVDGVLDTCRELGITLLAYSPLEQGLLTGKYTARALPVGPRMDTAAFRPANVAAAEPVVAVLRAIADRYGVTPATVALAWLMAGPGVVPIAGAKSAAQAAENAHALDVVVHDRDRAALDEVTLPWRQAIT